MIKKTIILVIAGIFVLLFSISCAGNSDVQAPPFTLTDIKGNQVSLSDFKGQEAVLLLFFSNNTGTGQDPLLQSYLAWGSPLPSVS